MSTTRAKLTFGVAFGAVAAAIGIAAAGYGVGCNMAEIAAAGATRDVGSSLRQIVPEGTSSEAITQLEAGDLESAVQLLAQGATVFEEMQCVPSGPSVQLEKGASVLDCESGMRALFAGFFKVITLITPRLPLVRTAQRTIPARRSRRRMGAIGGAR